MAHFPASGSDAGAIPGDGSRGAARPLPRTRGRRRRWAVPAVVAFLGLVCPLPAHADPSSPGLEVVGHIPFGFMAQAGSEPFPDMLVDPGVKRGFMVPYPGKADHVRVFDLNSDAALTDLASPDAPGVQVAGNGNDGDALPVMDAAHHRIFYPPDYLPNFLAPCDTTYTIKVLNTQTLAWSKVPITCAAGEYGFRVRGISYDAQRDDLYLVGYEYAADATIFPVPNGMDHATRLHKVNPTDGSLQWSVTLSPPCVDVLNQGSPHGDGQFGRYGNTVYVSCQSRVISPNSIVNNQASAQSIVVGIPLDQQGKPLTNAAGFPVDASGAPTFAATPTLGGVVSPTFDAGAGLFLLTTEDSGNGFGTYVFSVTTQLFNGVVATGGSTDDYKVTEVGQNVSNGRLYMRSRHGIVYSDIRHYPVPAGEVDADLNDPKPPPTTWPITVDAQNNLVYVPDNATSSFIVVHDTIPPTPDVAPSNPDTATTDVAETPGMTAVNFSGSANAFGAYLLSEGGPNRLINNSDAFCTGGIEQSQSPTGKCAGDMATNPGDRVWFMGHVVQASITNEGANAVSAPVDLTDAATYRDMSQYGLTGAPATLQGNGVNWPGGQARCQDFGGGSPPGQVSTLVGTAHSTCDQANASVSAAGAVDGATALSQFSAATGMNIHVSSYQSSVQSHRDPKLGLVTTANAAAVGIGIDLPNGLGTISIGEVSTQAQTQAHGRPGTASGTFTRTISGFTAPGYSCQAACDPHQVISILNQALSGAGILAVFSLPEPDASEGAHLASPGGFQSVITKDSALRVSDLTVNDDTTDVVAGLQLTFFSDNAAGRSRQILQLAGVHAEAHYGIYLLSADGAADAGGTSLAPTAPDASSSTIAPGGFASLANPKQSAVSTKVPGPRTLIQRIVQALQDIWTLLVSDPKRALELATVWGLLFAPLYLAIRRRALLGRLEVTA